MLVALLGGVFLNRFVLVPNMTFRVMQSMLPGQRQVLVQIQIMNEGYATATNLRVTIQIGAPIQDFQYESAEQVTPTKENNNTLVLTLSRLIEGDRIQVVIICTAQMPNLIVKVSVRCDQGAGKEKQPMTDALREHALIVYAQWAIVVAMAAYFAYGLIIERHTGAIAEIHDVPSAKRECHRSIWTP